MTGGRVGANGADPHEKRDGQPLQVVSTGSGRLCGARTLRKGTPCRRPAGWGTDHPGVGYCKHHIGSTRNGRIHAARQAAQLEAARIGLAIETDPLEALGIVLGIAASQVGFLRSKVAELDDGDVLTKGELHPTIRALNNSIEQLRVAAKTAADAGVEQRRLELDEFAVDRVVSYIRAVLGEIGLTPAQQQQMRGAMAKHCQLLDSLGDRPRELVA